MKVLPLAEELKPAIPRRPTHYHLESTWLPTPKGGRILIHVIRCTRWTHPITFNPDIEFHTPFLQFEEYDTYFYKRLCMIYQYDDGSDCKELKFLNTMQAASYAESLCLTLNSLPENQEPKT